jgi:hypothetical protein
LSGCCHRRVAVIASQVSHKRNPGKKKHSSRFAPSLQSRTYLLVARSRPQRLWRRTCAHADRSRSPASAVSLSIARGLRAEEPRCDDNGFGDWLSLVWRGLLLAMLNMAPALAQPANDDFDSATVIPGLPFTDTVSTAEATTAFDVRSVVTRIRFGIPSPRPRVGPSRPIPSAATTTPPCRCTPARGLR